jgi:hypothetical protein
MAKHFEKDEAIRVAKDAAEKLNAAYSQRKARKTRKDVIVGLSSGIIDLMNRGMETGEIIAVLKETELGKSMKEGTLRTYIISICNTSARKKRAAEVAEKASAAASSPPSTPAQGVTA